MPTFHPVVCVLPLLLAMTFTGCAHENMYRAADLPAHLMAPQINNPQTVDLTRLAISQTGSRMIDKGDVLELTIAAGLNKDETMTLPVRVNERGHAELPVIGNVPVAGLEPEGAEAAIAAACIQQGLYQSPHVTVSLISQRVNRITVIGGVKKPTVVELPRRSSDLMSALIAAGGLASDAGTEIEIRQPAGTQDVRNSRDRIATSGADGVRPAAHTEFDTNFNGERQWNAGPRLIRVNLAKAAEDGTQGYALADGAIVRVEKRDPMPIHVMGLVMKPGRYEYPVAEELRLLDVIAQAGGLTSPVADKIYVIRKVDQKKNAAVIVASLRKAKRDRNENLRLTPGDIVSIERTPATIMFSAVKLINIGAGASIPIF
jgi:polysaccharide export outer membrane protein